MEVGGHLGFPLRKVCPIEDGDKSGNGFTGFVVGRHLENLIVNHVFIKNNIEKEDI